MPRQEVRNLELFGNSGMKTDMIKRIVIVLLVLLLPALLFAAVWQSYRYDSLEASVAELEGQQKELFEENKKIVMGIEFLKSPFRINKIAEEKLKLEKIKPEKVIRIELLPQGGRQDG